MSPLARKDEAEGKRLALAEPNLSGNEAAYLQECVTSGYVSSVGPFVDRFEAMVADLARSRHAVATTSGTAGLHVALKALGVGPGDLVIVPAYSFIASATAVSQAGAEPWFFDIGADSWTLDPTLLEAVLSVETEWRDGALYHRTRGARVGALMAVHALGHPADMDAIVELATANGLPVLADGAAALGATYKGRPVGELGAQATVFSFNGNKTITAGGGGAVAGNGEALMARIRHLSTTARAADGYRHDEIGFNYRMTNLQAAVGCAQLERLGEFVAAKRRIAACYRMSATPFAREIPYPLHN